MPKEKKFQSYKKDRYFNMERSRNRNNGDEKPKIKLGVISEELLSYYRNVSLSLENGFDDNDLKEQFLKNVYDALKDDGLQVSQNQTVSRILESLFLHSQPLHMIEFFKSLSKELTIVTFDRFASHVFQTLIRYLPAMYEVKEEHDSENPASSLQKSVEQLCTFMESHMRDIMTHTYASHVLRSFLEALGGVEVNEEVMRSRTSRTQRKADSSSKVLFSGKALSKDFSPSFVKLKDKIIKLCNFEDHLKDVNYCPVLQTVLLILHKTSPSDYDQLSRSIIQKTCIVSVGDNIDQANVSERLPHIVQNEIGSYLIELLITLASESQLKELYDLVFKDKLIYFAVHPIANFVLQKLISASSVQHLINDIMKTLLKYLEDILAVNHLGIVTKLAESCQKSGFEQSEFLNTLMSAFHCSEPESRQIKVVPLLASLQTYEVFFGNDKDGGAASDEPSKHYLKSCNIHGSLLLQQLLQFKNTKLIVSSLLDLSPAELSVICCDKFGSHIIDVFFQSKVVPDKSKNAFIKHLQGTYINIACNRNGSRCLENIWKSCSLNQRQMIAEELCKNQERIESDQWGHFLYNNFALFKFTQRKQEWVEIQGASIKKQRLLQDVLRGAGPKKKNKVVTPKNVDHPTIREPTEKQKRQTKSVEHVEPLVHEEQPETTTEDSSNQNKRKRKKDKKRVIRNSEQQDMSVSSTDQKELEEDSSGKKAVKNKHKKKKTERLTIVEDEENFKSQDNSQKTHKKKKKKNE
ncbi:hypothetical protein Btru_077716 [Bulinus truncatus]|nr:hypothetical protein Btru_077716 [Bulinus truncatus]